MYDIQLETKTDFLWKDQLGDFFTIWQPFLSFVGNMVAEELYWMYAMI